MPTSCARWNSGAGMIPKKTVAAPMRTATKATSGWARASGEPPPALPAEVVEHTRARSIEGFETLTGLTW